MHVAQPGDMIQTPLHSHGQLLYSNNQFMSLRKVDRINSTHPFLIPHLPNSFQPVLVTRRSASYRAPQTLCVLICGGSVSAFPIKVFVSSAIASDPKFCRSHVIFASTSSGRCPMSSEYISHFLHTRLKMFPNRKQALTLQYSPEDLIRSSRIL